MNKFVAIQSREPDTKKMILQLFFISKLLNRNKSNVSKRKYLHALKSSMYRD